MSEHLDDLAAAYVDGALSDEEVVGVEAHLAMCAPCSVVVAYQRSIGHALASLELVEPPFAFFELLERRGLRDRRADRRRVRFGVANLVASAAVWIVVLAVGQLSSHTVEPTVGKFITEHQAGLAGAGAAASSQAVATGSGDMPSSAARFALVSLTERGLTTQAVYTDGTDVVSVFREAGELDWAAIPASAKRVRVDGDAGAVIDQGDQQVLVFQRGDFVYTIVAPTRSGIIDGFAVVMPRHEDRSLTDRLKDAGLGLLDCFGLRG